MKFVKITRSNYRYEIVDYNDRPLGILVEFLTDAVTSDLSYDFYTNWLKGQYKQKRAYGNAYGMLEYKGKVLVHLQPYITGKKPYGKNPSIAFSVNREQMLDIINDWVYTISQIPKPSTILITQEGESVKFTVQD